MTEKRSEIISGNELLALINAVTTPYGERVCWASEGERAMRRDFAERLGYEFHDTGEYYLRGTLEPYPILRTGIDIISLAYEVLRVRCEKVESDDAAIC